MDIVQPLQAMKFLPVPIETDKWTLSAAVRALGVEVCKKLSCLQSEYFSFDPVSETTGLLHYCSLQQRFIFFC